MSDVTDAAKEALSRLTVQYPASVPLVIDEYTHAFHSLSLGVIPEYKRGERKRERDVKAPAVEL